MDKECNECRVVKDVSEFYRRYDKGEGHYRNTCKECLSKKKYNKLNKPRRVYASDEERKEAARDRAKQWYKDNTDKAKARIKDYYQTEHGKNKRRESLARRKKENPEYWRHKKKRDKAIRRSRELEAGPLHVSSIVVVEANNYKHYCRGEFVCEFCETSLGEDYHLEHLVPLSRNGTNETTNLGISCSGCNLTKLSKTVEEFRPDKVSYFKNRNKNLNG